jgi:hypothetical protein
VSDRDESLLDKLKDAVGLGDDEVSEGEVEIDMERPPDDASPHRNEPIGQIDGAAHAAARQGTGGGTGASGAMGGAGAAGPVGIRPVNGQDTDATGTTADAGAVKTEYEMGNEFDPDHERVAESGFSRQTPDEDEPQPR